MGARKFRVQDVVHAVFITTYAGRTRQDLLGTIWRLSYGLACRQLENSPVRMSLHGRRAAINFANPYPLFVREFRNYNAPQVELVVRSSEALGRAVNVVDVGAAVGDTALLLQERCGDKIKVLYCIEGDETFCSLLRANLSGSTAVVYRAMLSDRVGEISELMRADHPGTATSTGSNTVPATTLDELLTSTEVDVLKVDTDGLDGKILGGASRVLRAMQPSVLFEWHPLACKRAGISDTEAFDHLRGAGYTRFIFFNKYGDFSHFGAEHIDQLRDLCLSSSHLPDWHFDVVALHSQSRVDDVALADLRFWNQK